MSRTVVLRRNYLHFIKKYKRFEKRHSNCVAHCSPCFPDVKEGDIIVSAKVRQKSTHAPPPDSLSTPAHARH